MHQGPVTGVSLALDAHAIVSCCGDGSLAARDLRYAQHSTEWLRVAGGAARTCIQTFGGHAFVGGEGRSQVEVCSVRRPGRQWPLQMPAAGSTLLSATAGILSLHAWGADAASLRVVAGLDNGACVLWQRADVDESAS